MKSFKSPGANSLFNIRSTYPCVVYKEVSQSSLLRPADAE